MDFPSILKPSAFEPILLSDNCLIEVPKTTPVFSLWKGPTLTNNYNGKSVLEYEAKPYFAELVILRYLEKAGWSGVWVDTYKNRFLKNWIETIQFPPDKQKLFEYIRTKAGIRGGCFDVFCWKGDRVLFAESKRQGKDRIRPSQKRWLEAALASELPLESFLIVEWSVPFEALRKH
jgi:hypothetical protein